MLTQKYSLVVKYLLAIVNESANCRVCYLLHVSPFCALIFCISMIFCSFHRCSMLHQRNITVHILNVLRIPLPSCSWSKTFKNHFISLQRTQKNFHPRCPPPLRNFPWIVFVTSVTPLISTDMPLCQLYTQVKWAISHVPNRKNTH